MSEHHGTFIPNFVSIRYHTICHVMRHTNIKVDYFYSFHLDIVTSWCFFATHIGEHQSHLLVAPLSISKCFESARQVTYLVEQPGGDWTKYGVIVSQFTNSPSYAESIIELQLRLYVGAEAWWREMMQTSNHSSAQWALTVDCYESKPQNTGKRQAWSSNSISYHKNVQIKQVEWPRTCESCRVVCKPSPKSFSARLIDQQSFSVTYSCSHQSVSIILSFQPHFSIQHCVFHASFDTFALLFLVYSMNDLTGPFIKADPEVPHF